MVVVLLLQALPALAQESNNAEGVTKNYAFSVWATGGMYKNKFSFTLEGAYARNFNGLFGQVAVMTNHYDGMGEYGLSLGIGQQNSEFEWYVFTDSVYNTYLWTQLRAMFRLNLGWLNAGGTYTIPLQKSVKYNNTQEMRIEPVRKFDLSIYPLSWLRIYGNFYLIGKGNLQQKFDFGMEIRPVNMVSLRVDWNKSTWKQESVRDLNANWSLYSGWHMQNDFRITLNLILGSSRDFRQYPKKGNIRVVETLWPIEVAGVQNNSEEPPAQYRTIHCVFYQDVSKVVKPTLTVALYYQFYDPEITADESRKLGDERLDGFTRFGNVQMKETYQGSGVWTVDIPHVYIQPYKDTNNKHGVWVYDRMVSYDYKTYEVEIDNASDLEVNGQWLMFYIF